MFVLKCALNFTVKSVLRIKQMKNIEEKGSANFIFLYSSGVATDRTKPGSFLLVDFLITRDFHATR